MNAGPSLPVALCGMRCSGKTTVGRLLAARLGRPFLDLDDETCRFAGFAGHPAADPGALIRSVGWARFRELEAATVKRLLEPMPRIVLATGGGACERADNRAWLSRATRAFYLEVPVELLQRRLAADATDRPPLRGGPLGMGGTGGMGDGAGDPVAELPALLARRDPGYRSVAEPVACGEATPEEVVERLLARLAEESERGL